jgi:hypothetical protein
MNIILRCPFAWRHPKQTARREAVLRKTQGESFAQYGRCRRNIPITPHNHLHQ